MKFLIGDIGNTSTKICVLNSEFKILRSFFNGIAFFFENDDLTSRFEQGFGALEEDVDVKKHAVEYLYKIGSMKYTYDKVVTLKTEIYEIIEGLGGHDTLKALVSSLHEKIPSPASPQTDV